MIIEIIRQLEKLFPNKHISIEINYDLYNNICGDNKQIKMSWWLHVGEECCKKFYSISEMQKYIKEALVPVSNIAEIAEKIANPTINDLYQQRMTAVKNHDWKTVDWIDEQVRKMGQLK